MKYFVYLIVVLGIFFVFIRYIEKKSLFFPLKDIEYTPDDIGLHYERLSIETEDSVSLSAWYIAAEQNRATVLFSHGNGGNISHRLEKIKMLNDLGLNVLIFDYRGYGMSEGSPSEEGLYRDVQAVYTYMVETMHIDPGTTIGYGESLGGAVIIDLAGRSELGGIIIEGSFTSIADIAKKYFPFIPPAVYRSKFDSKSKVAGVTAPKLHFHSRRDEVVPYELGRKLFESAPEPKEFIELQGGHNDSFLVSESIFKAGIDDFVGRRSLAN
jgi:fermentation-respiration switch protein FrsA (DUF1100 family)